MLNQYSRTQLIFGAEAMEKLRTAAAEALPQTRRLGMGLALTSGALIVITLI